MKCLLKRENSRKKLKDRAPINFVLNFRCPYIKRTMSDNKVAKTVIDAPTITGLAAGIGWAAKKVVKENFTSDPSSSL